MSYLPISPGGRRYGRYPDNPNHPARALLALKPGAVTLPSKAATSQFMGPIRDQGEEGCHDESTEVLTSTGWKMWSEYDGKALLGTVNPWTYALEFQSPTAVQAYHYKGEMFYSDNRSLDFALTSSHRMFVRHWNQRYRRLTPYFDFKTVEDLGWYSGLLAAPATFRGITLDRISIGARRFNGDDFVALIGLVVSDGWVGSTESNPNRIGFASFKPDRRDMVASLARRIGFSETPGRLGTWTSSDPELAEWLRQNIYTGKGFGALYKRVPDILKCASIDQIETFLKFNGDHHRFECGKRAFYTVSRQLADDIQELLLRIGRRSIVRKADSRDAVFPDGHVLRAEDCSQSYVIGEWEKDSLSIERKKHLKSDWYDGNVFCATVPNSILVTRRNGRILISGNSCTGQMGAEIRDLLYRAQFKYEKDQSVAATSFEASASFVYKNNLIADGDLGTDAGSSIHQTFITLNQRGACLESVEPYSDADYSTAPSPAQYANANIYRPGAYHYLPDLTAMKSCIASGYSFGFGIMVYSSFESNWKKPGMMPLPDPTKEQLLGGHAQHVMDYDDDIEFPDGSKGGLFIQNSWGSGWGISAPGRSDGGCYWMPYAFVTSGLADDAWTIHLGKAWR